MFKRLETERSMLPRPTHILTGWIGRMSTTHGIWLSSRQSHTCWLPFLTSLVPPSAGVGCQLSAFRRWRLGKSILKKGQWIPPRQKLASLAVWTTSRVQRLLIGQHYKRDCQPLGCHNLCQHTQPDFCHDRFIHQDWCNVPKNQVGLGSARPIVVTMTLHGRFTDN